MMLSSARLAFRLPGNGTPFASLMKMMRVLTLSVIVAPAACEHTHTVIDYAGDAAVGDTGDAAGGDAPESRASDCQGFTACVHACGESNQEEAIAATCANGIYSCPSPLIPAAFCGAGSWPSGAFAGCGPWPQGYDCTCRSVCDQGYWTCPASACIDAGAGSSDAAEEASVVDSASNAADADPAACKDSVAADGGVTGFDDLPVAKLCAMPIGLGLLRWDTPCAGSIVVVQGVGVDCANYWLFDATTKVLQATAFGCVAGPRCTGGTPGFKFPSSCFDGNFPTTTTRLCTAEQSDASAEHADSGDDSTDSAIQ